MYTLIVYNIYSLYSTVEAQVPKILFEHPDGSTDAVEAQSGGSLMAAATGALVRGIVAECGGGCACATCHVYVEPDWYPRLPAPRETELLMLEGVMEPSPFSRLSCQIQVSEAMHGLRLRVPASQ
jgi:2Fe-2S ferredoxin